MSMGKCPLPNLNLLPTTPLTRHSAHEQPGALSVSFEQHLYVSSLQFTVIIYHTLCLTEGPRDGVVVGT